MYGMMRCVNSCCWSNVKWRLLLISIQWHGNWLRPSSLVTGIGVKKMPFHVVAYFWTYCIRFKIQDGTFDIFEFFLLPLYPTNLSLCQLIWWSKTNPTIIYLDIMISNEPPNQNIIAEHQGQKFRLNTGNDEKKQKSWDVRIERNVARRL